MIRIQNNKIVILCFSIVMLVCCGACNKSHLHSEPAFSPFSLIADTSELVVSDYIKDPQLLKSVFTNANDIAIKLTDDKEKVIVISDKNTKSYLYNIDFQLNDEVKSLLMQRQPQKEIKLKYDPGSTKVSKVQVKGEF
ncbi:MAG: hypothetical protein MI922_03980, partial [Bacteroidales bacterium]|nr:hypothetical protein [Bacteroidales bacterium]